MSRYSAADIDGTELPALDGSSIGFYDALAEARSYKPAWPIERIVALFRAEAGRQFDPDLAKLVADGLEQKGSRFFAQAPDLLF